MIIEKFLRNSTFEVKHLVRFILILYSFDTTIISLYEKTLHLADTVHEEEKVFVSI